jgi:hypothetical protein
VRPGRSSAVLFGLAGVALIVPILAAAVLNIGAFDFGGRPLGGLYLAAYVVVLVPTVAFIVRNRDLFGRL